MRNLAKRFFILPAAVLGVAFLAICVHFHTAWPWNTVIHEDGRHTFIDTVFYFEHALGELPVDILLSASVAGAMLWLYGAPSSRLGTLFGVVAILLDLFILAGAVFRAGGHVAWLYLMQFHTRDEAPMVFGSHWQYHLIAEPALMLLALFLAGLTAPEQRSRKTLWIAAWVIFAALTAVFGAGRAAFTDPRYLGHQARELFTHSLVTVPLAVGACLWFVHNIRSGLTISFLPLLGCAILGGYLAAGVFLTRSQQVAQSNDVVKLVCGHFFEHTLSYLVVPIHAAWFYLLSACKTPEARP